MERRSRAGQTIRAQCSRLPRAGSVDVGAQLRSGTSEGSQPAAGLIQATDGNFYGATMNGGLGTFGTLFKITPSGTLTTLYSFQT